jgi:hypothetical protein
MNAPLLTCIYCKERKPAAHFNREHVMQASMGSFRNALVLKEKECRACNDHFAVTIDLAFGRDSKEAFDRVWLGTAGGKVFKSSGLSSRVRVETDDPYGKRLALRAEPIAGSTNFSLHPQKQVVFAKPGGIDPIAFAANALPTPSELAAMGYTGEFEARVYGDEHGNIDRTLATLRELGFKLQDAGELMWEPGPKVMSASLVFNTADQFRAVAKVAFNYFAHMYGAGLALHTGFDQIRQYIRYNLPPARVVVKPVAPCGIAESPDGPFARAHWIALWRAGNELIAEVCFISSTCYRVLLRDEPFGTDYAFASAHIFDLRDMTVRPSSTAPSRMLLGF